MHDYGVYRAAERLVIARLKDSDGQLLEIGALYCCALHNIGWKAEDFLLDFGILVRYAGDGRFLDADTIEKNLHRL